MITRFFSVRRAAALGFFTVLAAHVPATSQTLTETAPALPAAEQSQPAPAPLSAEAAALKTALERQIGVNSTSIDGYASGGYAPLWITSDGTVSEDARALIAVLKKAGDHALPVAKYGGADLERQLNAPVTDPAGLEAALTDAYLTYAGDVQSGLLDPRSVDRELHIYPERADPGDLIRRAARADDMTAYLETLPPSGDSYRRLVERYAAFRLLGNERIWGEPVAKGRTMRPGERGNRVAQARARLTAMGDLDPNVYDQITVAAPADGTQVAANDVSTDVPSLRYDPTHFDDKMVEALQSFQARHGLNLDGVIGPATLKQMNISPETRAEQIAVNLERMRWMNRDLGSHHILVNLAGFSMDVVKNGASTFSSRVVIGKAQKHRTPEFSDTMTHMVVNPSWHVPRSIATKEILPKLRADPNYMAARGMRLVGADASAIDWSQVTARNFPGRITQRPGRRNALGTVKFMFPNDFAIYLHDTPSKRLFKRDVRAYSHGCIRVERPHELAAYLLSEQQADPSGHFKSILKRGRERRVNLDTPLPVHLTYRSAWIDDNGVEQFRGDIYGRDRKIANAMKSAGVSILQ